MSELYNILKQNTNEDGLPVIKGKLFEDLTEQYGREEFREQVAKYIEQERPPFPLKSISYGKMKDTFIRLLEDDVWRFVKPNEQLEQEVVEKYDDYKYPYSIFGLGMVNAPSTFNDASDYFMQDLRLSCDSYGHKAPLNAFRDSNAKQLKSALGAIWRGVNDITKEISTDVDGNEVVKLVGGKLDETAYRTAFRLGAYIATQFKPVVAKCFYEMTDAKTVLDTSCGWGDRLCGFYASKRTTHYIGTDPNPATFERYKKQCITYETILTGKEPDIFETEDYFSCIGSKKVEIHRCGAEDLNYDTLPPVDCAFTSPPYFSTERYNEGGEHEEDQSWSKFNEYNAWRDEFYLPVAKKSYDALANGGVLYINILDPKINGVRYRSGDEVIQHIGEDRFDGQIGMRIMQRPQGKSVFKDENGDFDKAAMDEYMKKYYIENIWCFSKGVARDFFKDARVSTLDEFFG